MAEATRGGATHQAACKLATKHLGAGLEAEAGSLWPSRQSDVLKGQQKADAAPSAAAASSSGAGKDGVCPAQARANPTAASAEWPGWGAAEGGKPHHEVVSSTGAALVGAPQQPNTWAGCFRCVVGRCGSLQGLHCFGIIKIAAS